MVYYKSPNSKVLGTRLVYCMLPRRDVSLQTCKVIQYMTRGIGTYSIVGGGGGGGVTARVCVCVCSLCVCVCVCVCVSECVID